MSKPVAKKAPAVPADRVFVTFAQFTAKFEVLPGVYVDELSGKPVAATLSDPHTAPTMWLEGRELVLSTGDRFPLDSAVFRYRLGA